jgi:hypothetical protein
LTIQTSAGAGASSGNLTITGASEGLTANATLALTVNVTDQSFTLTPAVSTITVAQGQSGNTSITMTPAGGFTLANSPLTYTCTTAAPESTCTMSPSTATNTNPVTLSVNTTAPITLLNPPFSHGSRIFYAALLPGLFGIFLTVGSGKRGIRGMRLLGLIVVLGFSTMWMTSCGGSAGSSRKDPGTAAGSYMVTVNATTGGAAAVTGSTTVTLTVTAR